MISVLGSAVFGTTGLGQFLSRLLILMVLTSAAASAQITILPAARTALSMAAYGALPPPFANIHPRNMSATISTLVMGAVSIALYVPANFLYGGNLIGDAVTAIGFFIAFYYGITGLACTWYYRKVLTRSARNLLMRGILPGLGGVLLFTAGIYSLQRDWLATTGRTFWTVPGLRWQIGGIFLIAAGSAIAGAVAIIYMRVAAPAFFKGQTVAVGILKPPRSHRGKRRG